MKVVKNMLIVGIVLVLAFVAAVKLSPGTVLANSEPGQVVQNLLNADDVQPTATPALPVVTATPYPTPMTLWDQHFAQLDAAIDIPDGKDRITVKYKGVNGQYYFVQKYIDPSTQKPAFVFYRAMVTFVASDDPAKAKEVVVPVGSDIGQEAFFWEAIKTNWATTADFGAIDNLSNDPWYNQK